MAISRADAADYLARRYGTLLADAGIAPDGDGLGPAIDDALLLLGTAYADLPTATVDDAQALAYRAVLAYALLEHAYAAVLNRVTTSTSIGAPSVSKSEQRGQAATAVKAALDAAKETARDYVDLPDANSWQAPARLGLDTYSPPIPGIDGPPLGVGLWGWGPE